MRTIKSALLSACILIAFAVVVGVNLKPLIQSSNTSEPSMQPPTITNADGITNITHTKQNELYFSTSPTEWFSVGDEVNWNNQLIFKVEKVKVSKTLPSDIDAMTEWYIYGFDHYQQLVENDPNKIFIDVTIQATCIGLPLGSLYGMDVNESYCSITTGQAAITYYDETTGQLIDAMGDGVGTSVATQDLSGNSDQSVGIDYYQLSVDETAHFRVLYIISEEMWNEKTVLLTPQCGRYNTDQMNWMYYDQPHIYLNEHN